MGGHGEREEREEREERDVERGIGAGEERIGGLKGLVAIDHGRRGDEVGIHSLLEPVELHIVHQHRCEVQPAGEEHQHDPYRSGNGESRPRQAGVCDGWRRPIDGTQRYLLHECSSCFLLARVRAPHLSTRIVPRTGRSCPRDRPM